MNAIGASDDWADLKKLNVDQRTGDEWILTRHGWHDELTGKAESKTSGVNEVESKRGANPSPLSKVTCFIPLAKSLERSLRQSKKIIEESLGNESGMVIKRT